MLGNRFSFDLLAFLQDVSVFAKHGPANFTGISESRVRGGSHVPVVSPISVVVRFPEISIEESPRGTGRVWQITSLESLRIFARGGPKMRRTGSGDDRDEVSSSKPQRRRRPSRKPISFLPSSCRMINDRTDDDSSSFEQPYKRGQSTRCRGSIYSISGAYRLPPLSIF